MGDRRAARAGWHLAAGRVAKHPDGLDLPDCRGHLRRPALMNEASGVSRTYVTGTIGVVGRRSARR